MDKRVRVLILEDDLKTISVLLDKLSDLLILNQQTNELEKVNFDVTVIADSGKASRMLSMLGSEDFDLILLDRDCVSRGSFHAVGIGKFDPDRVIAISSVPEFNQELEEEFGITKRVEKRLGDLEGFAESVSQIVEKMLT